MHAERSHMRVKSFVVRGQILCRLDKSLPCENASNFVYMCVRDRSSENNYVHEYMCMCFVCFFGCLLACLLVLLLLWLFFFFFFFFFGGGGGLCVCVCFVLFCFLKYRSSENNYVHE